MFDNIGEKIKTLAKICCWAGIALSIICGLVLIFLSFEGSSIPLFLSGILVSVLGSLASYAGLFVLYGFGELVENSDIRTELSVKAAMREEEQK